MHQNTLQDADKLETLVQKRTVELSTLQAQEPPLKVLEEEYIRLKSDQTKFISFIELHKQKADKIRQGIVKARSVIADNGKYMPLSPSHLRWKLLLSSWLGSPVI
jgi:kinetochore protein NDC80